MSDKPQRVWIHPDLKNTLEKLSEKLNNKSLAKTGYPIPRGLPVASKIASNILEQIITNNNNLKIKKLEKGSVFNSKLDVKIKNPIFLIVFNPNEENNLNNFVDKEYLNINLLKKLGLKENEIKFI